MIHIDRETDDRIRFFTGINIGQTTHTKTDLERVEEQKATTHKFSCIVNRKYIITFVGRSIRYTIARIARSRFLVGLHKNKNRPCTKNYELKVCLAIAADLS